MQVSRRQKFQGAGGPRAVAQDYVWEESSCHSVQAWRMRKEA